MRQIIDFLYHLNENNNRVWFNEHKAEYLRCKDAFDRFVAQLIENLRIIDPSIGTLTPKDCTYRIYRDTRFSSDKSPYKAHMGAFIAPHGKKSGFSGYYLQVGPSDKGFDSGCMLATGNYYCDNNILRMLREDIDTDGGTEFATTLDRAKGFSLDTSLSLKRTPAGFDADAPYASWLRLKNFCLVKDPGVEYMCQPDLLKRVTDDFASTTPFLNFINRAIEYSRNPDQ